MFNMFEEHLFVCQSFLKERRRPPTGGLREALRSYWREGGGGGGGFSCPHPLEWVEKTLEPLQLDFPLLGIPCGSKILPKSLYLARLRR